MKPLLKAGLQLRKLKIKDNEYFGLLHKHKVQFYDKSNKVNPFKLKNKKINIENIEKINSTSEVEYESINQEEKTSNFTISGDNY